MLPALQFAIITLLLILVVGLTIFIIIKQNKMTADVEAALAQFKTDLTTLLTDVSAKLQAIATAPTTDQATVDAVTALDKTVTDFTAALTPTA